MARARPKLIDLRRQGMEASRTPTQPGGAPATCMSFYNVHLWNSEFSSPSANPHALLHAEQNQLSLHKASPTSYLLRRFRCEFSIKCSGNGGPPASPSWH